MVGEEIILEIDATLDRLICNAEAVQNVNFNELSETEIKAFQKTQESLLQHLMHMDQDVYKRQGRLWPERSLNEVVDYARRFSFDAYIPTILQPNRLSPSEREAFYQEMSTLI